MFACERMTTAFVPLHPGYWRIPQTEVFRLLSSSRIRLVHSLYNLPFSLKLNHLSLPVVCTFSFYRVHFP